MAIPNAPTGLTATPITASRIDLRWVDNASDETGYELERSDTGVGDWVQIDTPAANATSYSDTGLDSNATYYYRILATNGDGDSAYSNVASALTLLPGRAPLKPRLYVLQPDTVFAARVNLAAASYPLDQLTFDGVTTGAYTDIGVGMTVLLGTAAGLDDLGSTYVRKPATSSVIYVGRSSRGTRVGELTATDNAYITVLNERLVWMKPPHIDSTGNIYKDSDVPVGDYTTDPPPVAVAQASFAATIDPDTELITVLLNAQFSFATADDAMITTYAWDIADGTVISGAIDEDVVTATFPAGQRYIALTVTDDNGKSHTTYRLIYARDPANDTSVPVDIESHRISEAGQQMTVRVLEALPRSTYRENAPCLMWEREPSGSADRDHMLMVGYLHDEPQGVQAGRVGNARSATLQILDVAGKLDTLPGLPQSLANDDSRDTELIPSITWSYMVNPTLDKYLHYLLLWHSTALEVADFTWTDTGDLYQFVLLSSDGESLWQQIDRRARAFLPDYVLTCDRRGRIAIVPDPMLRDADDRTAVVLAAIDESDYSDIQFTSQRAPRVHWLRGSAILEGATEPIGTAFSIAPGDTPGQGLGEMTQGEQLALSQSALNAATGHRYARTNAPYSFVRLTLVQDDGSAGSAVPWREIEPAYKQWVTLTMGADVSPYRGVVFDTVRALPREINIRYDATRAGLLRVVELTLELETVGEPGKTVIKPSIPAVGELPDPPPSAPDFGLIDGQELVAGIGDDGYVYRTADFQTPDSSGGPTWDRVDLGISEAIYSWVVDPFSPGYINGSGAINGWIATETDIYRVEDLFGTPSATSVHTFATATTLASGHWRTIQASFGAFFEADNPWLLCVSYYKDASGHEGTWALRSVDGGVTWETEVQISAHYDTANTSTRPIGVYTSPKTPGMAFTAAYISTHSPALAMGFVSEDYGATWTSLAELEDSVDNPLPRIGVIHETSGVHLGNYVGSLFSGGIFVRAEGEVPSADSGEYHIIFAPPEDAVRMVIEGNYGNNVSVSSDAFTSFSTQFNEDKPVSELTETNDTLTLGSIPGTGGSVGSSFTVEWTRTGGETEWLGSREAVELSEPTSGVNYARLEMRVIATKIGGSSYCYNTLSVNATVTEIELEDGTIYTPGTSWLRPINGFAGAIHLPWPTNDDEDVAYYGALDRVTNIHTLVQSNAGVQSDVSPLDGSVSYGVNHYGFAVRSYDGDRNYMAVGGIGNDAGTDKVGLWVSNNSGAAWTNILAPVAATNALWGLQIAFGGANPDVLFAWGGYSNGSLAAIYYSDDFGTLDSREGNINSLGTVALIGIAGGPTA